MVVLMCTHVLVLLIKNLLTYTKRTQSQKRTQTCKNDSDRLILTSRCCPPIWTSKLSLTTVSSLGHKIPIAVDLGTM